MESKLLLIMKYQSFNISLLLLALLRFQTVLCQKSPDFFSDFKVQFSGEIKRDDNYYDIERKYKSDETTNIPENWDWKERGLMTTDLNQHIPTYWYFFFFFFPILEYIHINILIIFI